MFDSRCRHDESQHASSYLGLSAVRCPKPLTQAVELQRLQEAGSASGLRSKGFRLRGLWGLQSRYVDLRRSEIGVHSCSFRDSEEVQDLGIPGSWVMSRSLGVPGKGSDLIPQGYRLWPFELDSPFGVGSDMASRGCSLFCWFMSPWQLIRPGYVSVAIS